MISLFEGKTTEGLLCRKELRDEFIGYGVNIFHQNIDRIGKLVLQCQSKLLLKNLQEQTHDEHERMNYDTTQGFMIGEWTLDTLKKLLSSSTSLLLCIIDKQRNKLAGYQVLTSISNFIEIIKGESGVLALDPTTITAAHWKEFISCSDIRYSEQISVAVEYRHVGIGTFLMELAKSHSIKGICTDVIVWPHNNVASINYHLKNGFQPIGIVNQTSSKNVVPYKSKLFIWPAIESQSTIN